MLIQNTRFVRIMVQIKQKRGTGVKPRLQEASGVDETTMGLTFEKIYGKNSHKAARYSICYMKSQYSRLLRNSTIEHNKSAATSGVRKASSASVKNLKRQLAAQYTI